MNIRTQVIVRGLVQGVNFRYHTLTAARSLGITGWVRNLPDGSVEGCFEGDESRVTELVSWCRQGPGSARVDDLTEQRQEYRGEFGDFVILR
jgi:acylphosphatase